MARGGARSPCSFKGFGREHRADYYREHKRPKKLWLKPFVCDVRAILCAACQCVLNPARAERLLPLNKGQMESLRQALRSVADPRKSNCCRPLSVLLCPVCMGLLAGR